MKKIILLIFMTVFYCIQLEAQTFDWRPLPEGIKGTPLGSTRVESMVALKDTNLMYVVGNFDTAGSLPCSGFAIWNGLNFSVLNGGPWITMSSYLNHIAAAGGTPPKLIYLVDNQSFTLIGQANSDIHCLIEYKGDLYAGGDFTDMDGVQCNNIARWDGTSWHPCGTGLTGPGGAQVFSLGVYNNKLYVGGAFEFAGGITSYNLAMWDSTNWQGIGIGTSQSGDLVNAPVKEMGTFSNKLFISGNFNEVNGLYTSQLAYTDGIGWFPTNFPSGSVTCIKEFNSKIYVSAFAYNVYNSTDGVNYSDVGLLFNSGPRSLEVFNDTLYVGGQFTMCGDTPCYRIARLVQVPNDTTTINEMEISDLRVEIYPNPANETLTLTAENIKEIVVSNLLGEVVQSLKFKVQSSSATIDISKLPQGIYLLRFQTNNGWRVGKVVKE